MKRTFYSLIVVLLFPILFTNCGPRIYSAPGLATAKRQHKTVAIIPAEVIVKLRPREMKKMSIEELNDLNEKTAYDVQDKIYGWFLQRQSKLNYTVEFQDINRTNARITAAKIKYDDLKNTDRAELAKLLDVDAVLQCKLVMEKPMSDGAAIATAVLLGYSGNTNQVATTVNIHDAASGTLLWKYDYTASGSLGSSPARLVDGLMRNVAKRFPYKG